MIAGFLNDLLSEAGYAVHLAHTGQAALDRLATAERDEIDLVLLDVATPGLSGIEAAPLLRQAVASAKIIFLSQNDDPDLVAATPGGRR